MIFDKRWKTASFRFVCLLVGWVAKLSRRLNLAIIFMVALSLMSHWVLLSRFGFGYGKAAQPALKLTGRKTPRAKPERKIQKNNKQRNKPSPAA
jgi:hypothetical protein